MGSTECLDGTRRNSANIFLLPFIYPTLHFRNTRCSGWDQYLPDIFPVTFLILEQCLAGTSFHRSIAMVFNETTNYGCFYLARLINVIQKQELQMCGISSKAITLSIKPHLSLLTFHGEHSSYINRTSRLC